MTYISKLGLPLTNTIDIVADVFDVNLSLQKNSIPMAKNLGIFNTTFSEFNTSLKDQLRIQLEQFIENNSYLTSNIVLEPDIDIENKLLKITIKIIDNGDEEKRGLIFNDVF